MRGIIVKEDNIDVVLQEVDAIDEICLDGSFSASNMNKFLGYLSKINASRLIIDENNLTMNVPAIMATIIKNTHIVSLKIIFAMKPPGINYIDWLKDHTDHIAVFWALLRHTRVSELIIPYVWCMPSSESLFNCRLTSITMTNCLRFTIQDELRRYITLDVLLNNFTLTTIKIGDLFGSRLIEHEHIDRNKKILHNAHKDCLDIANFVYKLYKKGAINCITSHIGILELISHKILISQDDYTWKLRHIQVLVV